MSNTVHLAMKIKKRRNFMNKVVLDILLIILAIVNLAIANNKISKICCSVCIVCWIIVTFLDLTLLLQ